MQEPKVQENGYYWNEPDKEWLEDQYVIQGKTLKKISQEFGPSKWKIGSWLDIFNISKRGPGKVKPAKSVEIDGILMRPPISIKNGPVRNWASPDKAWLEYQYLTLDKSANEIGREFNINPSKIGKWMQILDIPRRTKEECDLRHSKDMRLTTYGTSVTQKRDAERAGRSCICAWCGEGGEAILGPYGVSTSTCSLDLHHKNHNPNDGRPTNLIYLCHSCHMLETALWHIRKSKKANVSVSNKIIIIDFNV